MKYFSPLLLLLFMGYDTAAQEIKADDSARYQGLYKHECPGEFLAAINDDSLKGKAVLLVLNEALNPIARSEFLDNKVRVRTLHIPMRMNRCTLLYIDTGQHAYHTIYQQLKVPVNYHAGKIYFARLFSRRVWPLGGLSIIKKNENGEKVEYAAVLFEYISAPAATELYKKMNRKEILVNAEREK